MQDIIQVFCDPCYFICPGRRILPWSSGKDVDVKILGKLMHCGNSPRHRIHPGKDTGNFIQPAGISSSGGFIQPGYPGFKIDKDVIHVKVKALFEWHLHMVLFSYAWQREGFNN